MKFLNRNKNIIVAIWIFMILLLALISLLKVRKGFIIETNILKMLPSENENRLFNEASDRFSEKLSRNVLFTIEHRVRDSALDAATAMRHDLSRHELFKLPDETDWFNFYFNYRFNIIPPQMKLVLSDKKFEHFRTHFYKTLFSPMTNIYGDMLNKDPLLIFPQYINSVVQFRDKFDYDKGNIIIDDSIKTTVLISTYLGENGFEKEVQNSFNDFVNKQKKKIRSQTGANVEYTGVVAYASRYLNRSKFETGFIGLLSFSIIVILMLFAFRSFKCLLWGAFPIIIALMCGLAVSVLVFDRIHIISITMGMCLIGICIDYSFHYLSEYSFCKSGWNSSGGLINILPGISMGLITTIMGYSTFFFIPFDGLKQIAIFTVSGLIAAYLTVLILFPAVFKEKGNYKNSYHFFRPLICAYFRLMDKKMFRYTVYFLLILIIIAGLPGVSFNDDIKVFQMKTADLDKTVTTIKELTNVEYDSEYLLVKGVSKESLLQNIETVTEKLEQIRVNGDLADYQALTKFVPSKKEQKAGHEMLATKVLSYEDEMGKLFDETGFQPQTLEKLKREIEESKGKYLTIDDWLKSSVATEYEKLWIGEISDTCFSAILLSGIKFFELLEEISAEDQNVYLVNNNTRISNLLRGVRKNLFRFIPVLYSIVFLVLVLRYGLIKGLKVFAPSIMTLLLTVSIYSIFSVELNIMHILALILVLALGIDYSIYLAESVANPSVTIVAILLSALTTIFSFGMLSLSMIPALSSIGFTILIGISINLFLSPLASDRNKLIRIL